MAFAPGRRGDPPGSVPRNLHERVDVKSRNPFRDLDEAVRRDAGRP